MIFIANIICDCRFVADTGCPCLFCSSEDSCDTIHKSAITEKLPLPRLGLDLTVLVSPWSVSTLACPDSGSPTVATVTLTPSSLLNFMFTVSGLLSHFINGKLIVSDDDAIGWWNVQLER